MAEYVQPDEYRERTAETLKFKECTEKEYNYGLECLPPALWLDHGFLVGEPSSHTGEGLPTFQPFIRNGGMYYRGDGPVTRKTFRTLTHIDIASAIRRGLS